jgi:hypothetical protein
MGQPVLVTKYKSKYNMKNLLLILGIVSLGFFSACGGGHDHDCCGECSEDKAECCGKCGGDKADEGNGSK